MDEFNYALFDIKNNLSDQNCSILGNIHGNDYVIISVGMNLFYLCIGLYLYGDLAIYAAAVPKSMRDVAWYVLKYKYLFCRIIK